VIAEVGLRLVADSSAVGFAAMLRNPRIVVDAHPADVQLGAALRALIEPPQRQTQMRHRSTAFPADEIVTHGSEVYPLRLAMDAIFAATFDRPAARPLAPAPHAPRAPSGRAGTHPATVPCATPSFCGQSEPADPERRSRPRLTRLGTHIDDPVGLSHDVEVVLTTTAVLPAPTSRCRT